MEEKEALKLFENFVDAGQVLVDAELVRNVTTAVGDWGEKVAAQRLDLILCGSANQKGYDATKQEGDITKYYQIKTRQWGNNGAPGVFPMKEESVQYMDYLVYVELGYKFEVKKGLLIPKEDIGEKVHINRHDRITLKSRLFTNYGIWMPKK